MKSRSLLTFLLISALTLSACNFKYTNVEYNNLIVEAVSESTEAIKSATETYNDAIPEKMNELIDVDTTAMGTGLETAKFELSELDMLYTYESRDLEQQTSVQTELGIYEAAADDYLLTYEQTYIFYSEEKYKLDVSQIEPNDEDLHIKYTTFLEAHNDLVLLLKDTLEEGS